MKKLIITLICLILFPMLIGCASPTSTSTPDNQKIIIRYSTIIYAEPWIGDRPVLPSSDSELVIATFTVENQGYPEFEINKNYFSAVVKGTAYLYDSSCYVSDLLPDTNLVNGGTAAGNVPYQLPHLTLDPDITWQYAGPGNYNIEWINLEPPPPNTTQTGI